MIELSVVDWALILTAIGCAGLLIDCILYAFSSVSMYNRVDVIEYVFRGALIFYTTRFAPLLFILIVILHFSQE